MIGKTNANSIVAPGGWVRPTEWLEISHLVTDGEQKFVGLYAVWDDNNVVNNRFNNYCRVKVGGNYTVDWGDGTVENFASGVGAEHTFVYANLPDSTICERGHKQAIITITPQAGQNITYYTLGEKHTSDIHTNTTCNWLDINCSGTHMGSVMWFNSSVANALFLQKVRIYQNTNACTSMQRLFNNCRALQSIDLSSFNTASVSNMRSMFYYCYSLQSLDLSSFNTESVTDMSYMFNSCTSLQSIDLSSFNTASVTDMSYMFNNCNSLQSIDLSSFNTESVTDMSYMFNSCTSLQSIDLSSFNTASVTNMTYMFNYCYSLEAVNLAHTTLAAATTITRIFATNTTMSVCRVPNISLSFTVASSNLDATNLDLLFTDLKDLTGFTQQTITITGNPGAATCTKTIATNKNWLVVG